MKEELSKNSKWGTSCCQSNAGHWSKERQNEQKIFVCQSEYTKEVLDRFGMSDSKHVAAPMDKSYSALLNQDSVPENDVPYRQAIGSLMYLMIGSRPDLAYVIG